MILYSYVMLLVCANPIPCTFKPPPAVTTAYKMLQCSVKASSYSRGE